MARNSADSEAGFSTPADLECKQGNPLLIHIPTRSDLLSELQSARADLLQLLEGVAPGVVRKLSGRHFNHRDAQTPYVTFHIIPLLVPGGVDALWRHVGFATGVYCFSERVYKLPANAKVTQLDLACKSKICLVKTQSSR